MEDQAVPVVSYARISADTARDEHGVADQHKVNRETAARLGWTVVNEITDNDRSASKLSVVREGFEQLLRILWSGHLPDGASARGVVVVADDRLARRSGDYERFVDALTHQCGSKFLFLGQAGPTRPGRAAACSGQRSLPLRSASAPGGWRATR